ncbi:hypothetical protein J5X84_28175 [Streptosporangiaceae bacterium NEAU-GS5]|nr:hypothetical protein [Streptosporangiaceae bacterium NEAU-GS5]
MIEPSEADTLLGQADAARAAGRGEVAARLYERAAVVCRAADDLDGWTRAVLGAASVHLFGTEPGRLPAELYDVLARTTDDLTRARLEAALARCWAYAGNAERGVRFADEAVRRAERAGDPALIADCLDAALAVHWGPDDLDARRSLAARLDEVTAHVLDGDARLRARLWSLQAACEVLDVQAIHRQMRALERLGEDWARARFFAASRRLMLDLLLGRTDSAARLKGMAAEAAEQAGLADAWMVVSAMGSYAAAQSGDRATCAAGAAECEKFALAEGISVLCAEAAFLWTCAGDLDRARALVNTFHGRVLGDLPRDMNWLLTLQCVLEAALAVGDLDVVGEAAALLGPYRGRAVINAGAVMFHGLTSDTLARAARLLGDSEAAESLRAEALAVYDRVGARWWRDRLASWGPPADDQPEPAVVRLHLRPAPDGLWVVGTDGATTPVRALRGYAYLRELLRRPNQPISALDLVGATGPVADESSLGPIADRQALAAYRERLGDLERELAEAEEWADLGRLDGLREERDALLGELARDIGLGGRPRSAGSSRERARIAVKKAISAAVDRLSAVDETLADHLRPSLHTGLTCVYQPDPRHPAEWVLD